MIAKTSGDIVTFTIDMVKFEMKVTSNNFTIMLQISKDVKDYVFALDMDDYYDEITIIWINLIK